MPRAQAIQRAKKVITDAGSASKVPATTVTSRAEVPPAWKPERGAGTRSFADMVANRPGSKSPKGDSPGASSQPTRLCSVSAAPAEDALTKENQILKAENLLLKEQISGLKDMVSELQKSVQALALQVTNLREQKQGTNGSPSGYKSKGKPKMAIPPTGSPVPDEAMVAAIQSAVCAAVNAAMSRLVPDSVTSDG